MPPKRVRHKARVTDRVFTVKVPVRVVVKVVKSLVLMAVLVVAFVFLVHGVKELTATVVGTKLLEVLTDVLADRLFPTVGGE